MKIHRDNNNNSTCLKELADFEGGGGAMECLVHGGGRGYPWQVSLADRRTTMGVENGGGERRWTGRAKGRGLINNVGNWTPFDLR